MPRQRIGANEVEEEEEALLREKIVNPAKEQEHLERVKIFTIITYV